MIGQYFSQTNESATVPVLQNFLEVNKALQLKLRQRVTTHPVDVLVDDGWQLGLALDVTKDAAGDPAAVEELHRV